MPVFGSQQSGIVRPALLAHIESRMSAGWISNSTTTFTDVDATNLVITFVAPASGRVLVELNGLTYSDQTNPDVLWNLREGTTDVHPNGVGVLAGAASSPQWDRVVGELLITGLVPGKTYTWKWSHRTSTATYNIRTYAGGPNYPVSMKVYDAGTSQSGILSGGVWAGPQAIKQASSSDAPLRLQDINGNDLLKAGPTDLTGKLWRRSLFGLKAGFNVSGGGRLSVRHAGTQTVDIAWNKRFIIIAQGTEADICPPGHYNINVPPNGTVITGLGGAANTTVASGFIRLQPWQTLWYILPLGNAGSNSVDANFRVVSYAGNLEIPEHWVQVAVNYAEEPTVGEVKFCDGRSATPWIQPAFQNNWQIYGAPWGTFFGYRKQNGIVQMRGLMHSGTMGVPAFNMAEQFRPVAELILPCASHNGTNPVYGEARVYPSGDVSPIWGGNSWFSIAGINYPAET